MPRPMHTFRNIQVHIYTVVAVALSVGVVLFGLFIALERRDIDFHRRDELRQGIPG